MTAFSTFLPSLTSAISFICREGKARDVSALAHIGDVQPGLSAYLGKNHSGDLLRRESLGLAQILDLDDGVVALVNYLEGPRLNVLLHDGVIEGPADKTPVGRQVENG
jgi:hypothetical protein